MAEEELNAEARGAAPGRGRLEGRRVLVVGAGRMPPPEADPGGGPPGNGQAIAVLAAREGAAVAVVDVRADAARETAALVEREGARAEVVIADVADAAQCDRLVDEAAAALGGLDGVVANVGVGAGRGLEGTTPEVWDGVMGVNLRSHFLVARRALPLMESGALLFMSSLAALQPGTRIPVYDASKAALLALARHVALEGAPRGIRANALVPGYIDTPLGRLATAGRPSRGRTPIPLGRQGTAWEVAHAAIFLLSGEASYVTGQALVVDGGLSGIGPVARRD